jgi:hypothetical protein
VERRNAGEQERHRIRQDQAVPILNAFKTWLETLNPLPKTPLGKAVNSCLTRWQKLSRYTDNGRIKGLCLSPIDNNLGEEMMDPAIL